MKERETEREGRKDKIVGGMERRSWVGRELGRMDGREGGRDSQDGMRQRKRRKKK